MLTHVDQLGTVEQRGPHSLVRTRPRTNVRARDIRKIADPPAGIDRALLPIRLLRIKKEALIEWTDVVQRVTVEQQDRTDDETLATIQATQTEGNEPRTQWTGERPLDPVGA